MESSKNTTDTSLINQEQAQELLISVERRACMDSFYEFFLSFWEVIEEEPLVDNWHIKYICDELQQLAISVIERRPKPYDMCINIPPGTTKSRIVTVMFPAWLWTLDPSLRTISNSYSQDLSTEHALKSRDIITSQKYKTLFPWVILRRDSSGKSAYANTRSGARYTTSTGGTITGKHAHLIINDDPTNPQQALSTVRREEANRHTGTLSSRKVNKANTPIITVMQRLHVKDVTGYQLAKRKTGIKHICLPAELSDKVNPPELKAMYKEGLLDPIRMPKSVLDEAKIDLGTSMYTCQYEQSPIVDGGNIFKRTWFRTATWKDFWGQKGHAPIQFWIDTALTEKKANDPSGILATCEFHNVMYILYAEKVWKEFPELCVWVQQVARDYGYGKESMIRIEPKANGLSVIQTLHRGTSLNVGETVTPEGDKEYRARMVSPKVESGRVALVEGDWNEEFLDDVCGFPRAEHKEYVDLLGYALNYHFSESNEWEEETLDTLARLF